MGSLLDTDVLSQQTKPRPNELVVRWWRKQESSGLYLSVVSLAEIRFGIDQLQPSKKQRDLETWLSTDLPQQFAERLLPVTPHIANEAGRLMALAKKSKGTLAMADALIASTAMAHRLSVATLNHKHFEKVGVKLTRGLAQR